MDTRFSLHNSHLEDPILFAELAPQLRMLKRQTYIYQSDLLKEFPIHTSGDLHIGRRKIDWKINSSESMDVKTFKQSH